MQNMIERTGKTTRGSKRNHSYSGFRLDEVHQKLTSQGFQASPCTSCTTKVLYIDGSNGSYIGLLQAFPPRPIKSAAELHATQKVIDSLIDRGELIPDAEAYLDVLGTLVYEYEKKHIHVPDLYGVALLKALLIESNLRQKDLVPIFKTESIVSEVLNGQRNLTVTHIQKLADFFHLSPAAFLELK